ncbi:MAG: ATP-binding protein [Trichlorobacter sp.]|uniref:sensor histidine kinase n=1 Tax=Trichlorobacter sp. TaxID=2911007 RepID=UPI00256C4421|nr:ATP-binding protein [Trichlorobacter sp.]MDK9716289.1 ATP-binding protein [Trichlorobacter sp.]
MTADRIIPKSFGIARRFIIAIAIFSTILTLVGTCLQLYIDYSKDLRSISRQLTYIETSHLHSLINDIWLFNERGLEAQLKGILALPMIEALRLERKDGPELAVGQVTSKHLITHKIPLSYQHLDKTVPLGTLHITASSDHIIQRMKERVLIILFTQFVMIFCISAFIFILFYQLIGRHLAVMARHAAALTISTLHEPLNLERSPKNMQGSKDELDLLVDSLNSMQAQISDHLKERRQIEDTLHEQAALLEDEIAQRQQAEEELNVINCSLEERITDAIDELRRKDTLLLQQSKLAAMGELLNNIAHQWRQPLNNIAVSIQTMQYLNKAGELSQEEMDRDIKAVMDILFYMSGTIDDFRNFFIKDREKKPFGVQGVVEKTLNLVRSALDDKRVIVSLTAEPDVQAIGYPNEYAQSLMNILYNARDALLEQQVQEPRIVIAITQKAGRSVLTVADNAGGIPQQILPQIFEPYVTTKGPSQGTGIGLYMAKTMIERNMGGSLTARNTAEGAEFRIVL